MKNDPYRQIREEAYEANVQLPGLGLVIYTFGNVSALDKKRGVFAIKPSGVNYQALTPRSMVVVDLENRVVDGKLNPSSDTKTHTVLYRAFPQVGGITHTHSPLAVSWAQARRDIPVLGTTHADHLTVDIPCAPVISAKAVAADYETETGHLIVRDFKKRGHSPVEVPMVLVAGHGPFAWGKNAAASLYHAKVLEELAGMAMRTLQINSRSPRLEAYILKKHYERKHGRTAYYGQKGS